MAQKVQTKTGMSAAEGAAWWTGIFFTFGLLYPAYRLRKHSADRTTTTVVS